LINVISDVNLSCLHPYPTQLVILAFVVVVSNVKLFKLFTKIPPHIFYVGFYVTWRETYDMESLFCVSDPFIPKRWTMMQWII